MAGLSFAPAEMFFLVVLERQARQSEWETLPLVATALRRAAGVGWLILLFSVIQPPPPTMDGWLLGLLLAFGGFVGAMVLIGRIGAWLVLSFFWGDGSETAPPWLGWATVVAALILCRAYIPAAWEALQIISLAGLPLWLLVAAWAAHVASQRA